MPPDTTSSEESLSAVSGLPATPAGWILLGLISCLLFVLFHLQGITVEVREYGHSMFCWIARKWSEPGGTMSHGWLIPFISGFIVWRKREELAKAPKTASYVGLILVIMALLLHWVGLRVQQSRLNALAFVGLLWSIPLYLYGRQVGRIIFFPCAFLFFCVPWNFLDGMTSRLRLIATILASGAANGLGIGVNRVGTGIHSVPPGQFSFDVADACSGLRYFIALTALTALFAYLTQKTRYRQWILFLIAAPIAILANAVRIASLIIVACWFGKDAAITAYHDYSGLLVFIAATLLMVGAGRLVQYDYKGALRRWTSRAISTRS